MIGCHTQPCKLISKKLVSACKDQMCCWFLPAGDWTSWIPGKTRMPPWLVVIDRCDLAILTLLPCPWPSGYSEDLSYHFGPGSNKFTLLKECGHTCPTPNPNVVWMFGSQYIFIRICSEFTVELKAVLWSTNWDANARFNTGLEQVLSSLKRSLSRSVWTDHLIDCISSLN